MKYKYIGDIEGSYIKNFKRAYIKGFLVEGKNKACFIAVPRKNYIFDGNNPVDLYRYELASGEIGRDFSMVRYYRTIRFNQIKISTQEVFMSEVL